MIYRLTLKVGVVRGLVGDGVEDLVDFGVEIWLMEIPFTMWRKNRKEKYKSRERVNMNVSTTSHMVYTLCTHVDKKVTFIWLPGTHSI